MSTSKMVRELCENENISISEMARRIGQSPQNFNKKLQRDTLSLDEIMAIANAVGATYLQEFTLRDGSIIRAIAEENNMEKKIKETKNKKRTGVQKKTVKKRMTAKERAQFSDMDQIEWVPYDPYID